MRSRSVQRIGIVGLGLMGRGIASCLLANGFEVVGCDISATQRKGSLRHISHALTELHKRKLLPARRLADWQQQYHVVTSPEGLAECALVIESVAEDLELKRGIYTRLESILPAKAIIASNTSSLPITSLQQGRLHPSRMIGMHWGEPAEIMHYLEIIPGEHTAPSVIRYAEKFGRSCGKEPVVLKQDIRGFLSNRLMYAMMREACHLVEAGIADIADVDRSFRNDIGWWALLAGPFRWMDLTGIPAYAAVMEGLLPELSDTKTVPHLMKQMQKKKAEGISNRKGFYPYTHSSSKRWKKDWVDFTYDMKRLAEKYKAD